MLVQSAPLVSVLLLRCILPMVLIVLLGLVDAPALVVNDVLLAVGQLIVTVTVSDHLWVNWLVLIQRQLLVREVPL